MISTGSVVENNVRDLGLIDSLPHEWILRSQALLVRTEIYQKTSFAAITPGGSVIFTMQRHGPMISHMENEN